MNIQLPSKEILFHNPQLDSGIRVTSHEHVPHVVSDTYLEKMFYYNLQRNKQTHLKKTLSGLLQHVLVSYLYLKISFRTQHTLKNKSYITKRVYNPHS